MTAYSFTDATDKEIRKVCQISISITKTESNAARLCENYKNYPVHDQEINGEIRTIATAQVFRNNMVNDIFYEKQED